MISAVVHADVAPPYMSGALPRLRRGNHAQHFCKYVKCHARWVHPHTRAVSTHAFDMVVVQNTFILF